MKQSLLVSVFSKTDKDGSIENKTYIKNRILFLSEISEEKIDRKYNIKVYYK